jgi:hypothetical protein
MRGARLVLPASAVLMLLLGLAAPASAEAAQRTRLQIEIRRHDGRIFIFGGIIARDRSCRVGRKITVRQDGLVIGSGRARNGYWEIKPFADPPGDTPHRIKAQVRRQGECSGDVEAFTRSY